MREKRVKKSAKDRLLGYLGRRDHSERELRRKLSIYHEPDEIDKVIEWSKEHELLLTPEKMAEKFREHLDRRNKSHLYTLGYLREKGLPAVAKDPEIEFQKAKKVVQKKTYPSREKALASLQRQGFDGVTIRKVIYEVF